MVVEMTLVVLVVVRLMVLLLVLVVVDDEVLVVVLVVDVVVLFVLAAGVLLAGRALFDVVGVESWDDRYNVAKYVATEAVYVVTLIIGMLMSFLILVAIKWGIYTNFKGRSELFSIQFILWNIYGLLGASP